MTDITAINQSITDMTDDELFAKIKDLRTARRVSTPIPRHAKKKRKSDSAMKLAGALSANQLSELLSELEA